MKNPIQSAHTWKDIASDRSVWKHAVKLGSEKTEEDRRNLRDKASEKEDIKLIM